MFDDSLVAYSAGWYYVAMEMDRNSGFIRLELDSYKVAARGFNNCSIGDLNALYFSKTPQYSGARFVGCYSGYKVFQNLITSAQRSQDALAPPMASQIEPEFCDKDLSATLDENAYSASSSDLGTPSWNAAYAGQWARTFAIAGEACCWKPETFTNSYLQVVIRPRPMRLTGIRIWASSDQTGFPGWIKKYYVSYSNRISGHMTFKYVVHKITNERHTSGSNIKFYGQLAASAYQVRLPYPIDAAAVRLEVADYQTAPILKMILHGCSSM